MLQEEDLDYRSDRALRELHLGLTASSTSVARSHLQLPTTEDLKSGAGVTGGPDVVGEEDSTKGISGGHAQGSATGGG